MLNPSEFPGLGRIKHRVFRTFLLARPNSIRQLRARFATYNSSNISQEAIQEHSKPWRRLYVAVAVFITSHDTRINHILTPGHFLLRANAPTPCVDTSNIIDAYTLAMLSSCKGDKFRDSAQ
jgi:hypothetical protein